MYLSNDQIGDPAFIFNDVIFHILLWTKGIIELICYAGALKTAIEVMHPSYYKPYRWFIL